MLESKALVLNLQNNNYKCLLIHGLTFSKENIVNYTLQCSVLDKVIFFNCYFEEVDFTGPYFATCTFENCDFNET